jgi:hypothetical protein
VNKKISKKWIRISELYRFFARDYHDLDFSDDAALAMYDFESRGVGNVNHYDKINGKINGYAVGKHMLDLQMAMWKEDIRSSYPPILTKYELLTDPDLELVRWFLEEKLESI